MTVESVNASWGIDPIVTTILLIGSLIVVIIAAYMVVWFPQRYTVALAMFMISFTFIVWLLYTLIIVLNKFEIISGLGDILSIFGGA